MSKCSERLIRREPAFRKPTRIWKRCETSCLIRKRKQGWGGDMWNSEQPSPVANASRPLFLGRALVLYASKFPARTATGFFTAGLVARAAGKPTRRKASLNEGRV